MLAIAGEKMGLTAFSVGWFFGQTKKQQKKKKKKRQELRRDQKQVTTEQAQIRTFSRMETGFKDFQKISLFQKNIAGNG